MKVAQWLMIRFNSLTVAGAAPALHRVDAHRLPV